MFSFYSPFSTFSTSNMHSQSLGHNLLVFQGAPIRGNKRNVPRFVHGFVGMWVYEASESLTWKGVFRRDKNRGWRAKNSRSRKARVKDLRTWPFPQLLVLFGTSRMLCLCSELEIPFRHFSHKSLSGETGRQKQSLYQLVYFTVGEGARIKECSRSLFYKSSGFI